VAFNPRALLDWANLLDRLLTLEKKHGALIEGNAEDIRALADRLTRLEARIEAREAIMVAEAKGAAAAVASEAAARNVGDIYRRIGTLEERLRGSGAARLAPPDTPD
jgi:hypothetical protein